MTEPEDVGDDLDRILAWNLARAARFAGQRLTDRLAVHALHPIQFGVLAHLDSAGTLTQAEIARAVLVRPQSVAPLLDGLEARGLVARTGVRARGRRNPVGLTDAGRSLLRAAWPAASADDDLVEVGLRPAEAIELNRLLLVLVRAAGPATSSDGWHWEESSSP